MKFRLPKLSVRLACLPALALAVLLTGCSQTASPQSQFDPKKIAFWPAYPETPHVQYLRSLNTSADVAEAKGGLDKVILGGEQEQVMPVQKPYGVRMFQGQVFVCDNKNRSITIFDLRKHELRLMGNSGRGALAKPIDLAIADDGTKYVADLGPNLIMVYDANNQYQGQFGHKEFLPGAVAVWKDELYVANKASGKIEVLDRRSGKLLRTIGEPGRGKDQIAMPLGLAVDPQGNVYVSDMINCRVMKFNRQGKVIQSIGGMADRPGGFVRPKQIAVDSEGILYVVDASFQNVQMFNADGKMLMYFGGAGNQPGAMDLPAGIAVSEADLDLFAPYVHPAFAAQRLILVANQFGDDKINVYALGQIKPGHTVEELAFAKAQTPTAASTQPAEIVPQAIREPAATQPATAPAELK